MDLVFGTSIPNLPHYHMSPHKHAILQAHVNKLLQKRFIHESMSLYVVPTLLVPWELAHVCG